ncbi:MAG: nutA [Myxococcaceae bacterium]|nr:nutA [Myxococcaceae bacterium]
MFVIRSIRLVAVFLTASVAASCLPVLEGQPTQLANQEIRLTFLGTTDIHSRLLPYDFAPLKTDTDLGLIPEAGPFGGVARLGALLKRERASADRVLHLDSGDSFQGAPIFNVNFGEVEYKFLSKMRLDAAVIGNHEFDSGALNFTVQARDNATFPVLAANYAWGDVNDLNSNKTALYTLPYTIKNVGGVRVGIIGLANISSLNSIVEGGNSLQATPLEQNEAARGYVELLKPVTDVIAIVSHAGLTEDQELIQGYEAYFEFGKISYYLNRKGNQWKILEWFGPVNDPLSVVRVKIPGVSGVDVIIGGHLHIVLNPPQQLTDPSGRKVLLSHNGAFAKYLGRLDVVVKMPPEEGAPEGAEVVSHDYKVFPVDGLWCSPAMHDYYKSRFWSPGQFITDPQVQAALKQCTASEDKETTQLLQPYIIDLDFKLSLTSLFAYAPRDIARRNNSTGGDSPLGNVAADSMRKRRRVEAEVAVTNSLGIRDNIYAGPLTQESLFNVFPFENTINIMYLSGIEMEEMFDFITERSASRGCVSQAQISGGRFTMDCAQVQLNDLRLQCDPKNNASDCPTDDRTGRAPWKCLEDATGDRCWAHPATNIQINGKLLEPYATYRVAVNDYIAKGGSGFVVLKRNTTRFETGIPLRDSLIGYLQSFCSCDDILADARDAQGNVIGKNKQLCGSLENGKWTVAPQEQSFCKGADDYKKKLDEDNAGCRCVDVFRKTAACDAPEKLAACLASVPPGPALGKCTCRDALAADPLCGNVTSQIRSFCENPTALSIAVGTEDGRIARRVK